MILIEHIMVGLLAVYFLPFWWGSGVTWVWMTGLTISALTLTLMIKRHPASRPLGLILLVVAGYLPLKMGLQTTAAEMVRIDWHDNPLLMCLSVAPIIAGAIIMLIGFRMFLGSRERQYFGGFGISNKGLLSAFRGASEK